MRSASPTRSGCASAAVAGVIRRARPTRARTVLIKVAFDLGEIVHEARGREALEEAPAVGTLHQAAVETGQDAAIGRGTDQPTQPLLEHQDRDRHLVLLERVPAPVADPLDAGLDHGVGGRGVRQLVDYYSGELLPRDVHALPRTSPRQQQPARPAP